MEQHEWQWEQLSDLLRAFALRKFGGELRTVEMEFANLKKKAVLPVSPIWKPESRTITTNHRAHSPDFRQIVWDGERYELSEMQSRVVQALWKAWKETDFPDVSGEDLLRAADSDSENIANLFKRSEAWGKLIISSGNGRFRLNIGE